jgi:uncharacterized membrane protein
MEGEIRVGSHGGHTVDQRIGKHRHPKEIQLERARGSTLGKRAADWTSGFTGSWKFIFIYIGMTVGWCFFNLIAFVQHWDPYPFIFYTFSVSVLAILMSSLILLAGNRQAEVDRAHAENAYHHVDEVNAKQDQQLQILQKQLELLEQQVSSAIEQHGEILSKLSTILGAFRKPTTEFDEGGGSPVPAT